MANAFDNNFKINVVMHDELAHKIDPELDLDSIDGLMKCFWALTQGAGWILLKDGRKGNKEGDTTSLGAPWSENKVSTLSAFLRGNLTDLVCQEHPGSYQPRIRKHVACFWVYELSRTARAPIA